jgi:hypothetical protein
VKWRYRVDVGTISGEVETEDEAEALHATTDDALAKASDAVIAGTWSMERVDDDG